MGEGGGQGGYLKFRKFGKGENYIHKGGKALLLMPFFTKTMTRTRDLLITNQLLYRLSYFGKIFDKPIKTITGLTNDIILYYYF